MILGIMVKNTRGRENEVDLAKYGYSLLIPTIAVYLLLIGGIQMLSC